MTDESFHGFEKNKKTDVQIRNGFEEKNIKVTRQVDALQSRVELLEAQKLEAEKDAYNARFKAEYVPAFTVAFGDKDLS